MQLASIIKNEFSESLTVLQRFMDDNEKMIRIENAARLMADCLSTGGKIISCGNGGSHSDAMHLAEELTGRYRKNRRPLAAIAISDPAYITCVGNDFGYAVIFSRFIEALGRPGDILFAISTSGASGNILNAADAAKAGKMKVIALTGKDGGGLKEKADLEIRIDHFGYADRIQELHIKIIHTLVLCIEQLTFNTA